MPLTQQQLDDLAAAPLSASGDTGSYTERSAADLKELLDLAAVVPVVEATNVNGGPRSAWHCLRPARVQLPGARG